MTTAAAPGPSPAPLEVRLHYDAASTLCYVAHRCLPRIADELRTLGIALRWTPIDLARLVGWRRGGEVSEERRANAARVARELGVEVAVPARWLDARRAMAMAIHLEGTPSETAWRERMWTGVFEQRRDPATPGEIERWALDLGLSVCEADIESGLDVLESRTADASREQVTGVPTFMLDGWPFGGIQEDHTMRSVLRRYARKMRGAAGTSELQ